MSYLKKASVHKNYRINHGHQLLGTPGGPHLKPIAGFVFGFAPELIDTSGAQVALMPIPSDLPEIPNQIFDAPLAGENIVFTDERMLMKCVMPQGVVPPGQVVNHNLTGIVDTDGALMFMALDFRTELTSEDPFEVNLYLDMPEVIYGGEE